MTEISVALSRDGHIAELEAVIELVKAAVSAESNATFSAGRFAVLVRLMPSDSL